MISIIVPVYKVEKYLKKCIESILAQTYKDFELILVDDGSPDNSGAICDEYAKKDSRIKVIHKQNGGVSSARNAGIEIAKGEFINFVDSDDTIPCDSLENLIKLQKENDADLTCCTGEVYVNGEFSSKIDIIENFIDFEKLKSNESKMFLSGVFFGPYMKLFKTSILKESKLLFDTDVHVGEDTIFVFEYLLNSKKVHCGRNVVYYYLMNDQGLMSRPFSNFDEYRIKAANKQIEFFNSLKLDDATKYNLITYCVIRYLFYVIEHYLEHFSYEKALEVSRNFYNIFKDYFINKCQGVELFLIKRNKFWFKHYKILTQKNGINKYCKYQLKQKKIKDFKKNLKKIKFVQAFYSLLKRRKK